MWSVYEGRGYVNLLLAGVCGLASCSTFHLNAFSCTKNNVARHIDPEAFSTRVKAVVAFRGTWFVPRQCDIMSYELAKHTCHVSKRSRFWGLLRRIRWWCILGKQLSADGSCVWQLIHINLEGKRRKTCYIACRTGFFVIQKLRGTLIAATILKAIEKLIRQDSLSVSTFKIGGRTLLLSLFALQNAPDLQAWESMHLKIYEISFSQNVYFLWGTKVYKLGFSHDFSAGECDLIHCNCLFVCLYFFQGEWFWSKLWTNLEGSEKNLSWGNGIQWNISLSQRFKILFNRPRRTQIYYCYMINTVSHDVLVWIQGRNIFFMANRTQPQELITQKCSCYGQVDL